MHGYGAYVYMSVVAHRPKILRRRMRMNMKELENYIDEFKFPEMEEGYSMRDFVDVAMNMPVLAHQAFDLREDVLSIKNTLGTLNVSTTEPEKLEELQEFLRQIFLFFRKMQTHYGYESLAINSGTAYQVTGVDDRIAVQNPQWFKKNNKLLG